MIYSTKKNLIKKNFLQVIINLFFKFFDFTIIIIFLYIFLYNYFSSLYRYKENGDCVLLIGLLELGIGVWGLGAGSRFEVRV